MPAASQQAAGRKIAPAAWAHAREGPHQTPLGIGIAIAAAAQPRGPWTPPTPDADTDTAAYRAASFLMSCVLLCLRSQVGMLSRVSLYWS